MIRIYSFLFKLLSSLALMLWFASCDTQESALVSRAEEEGATAARELIADMPISEIDMQNRLLTIMSNEYELRKNGHQKAADAYIDSFMSVMATESDSLTKLLGYEKTID